MMGQSGGNQSHLFYSFNLDDHVPSPFYSHTSRPPVDPELMIRMLIIGYCFGIRSERRLCEEVHLNLADRWFCRLGLEEGVPEHSTFRQRI
jgi:transposase